MSQQQQEEAENLRELLRQHWTHCRHIESERAWFMNVYVLIAGGVITFTYTASQTALWPFYFLIIFTIIGLLLTVRWIYAFEHHRIRVRETASLLGVSAGIDIPTRHVWRVIRARYLFPLFYLAILTLLIVSVANGA